MLGEAYRVLYNPASVPHRVLLAVSGGASSLVLLDTVASLLQEQHKQHSGRMGFELVVVNVDETTRKKLDRGFSAVMAELAQRYEPVKIEWVSLDPEDFAKGKKFQELRVARDFSVTSTVTENNEKCTLIDQVFGGCPNRSLQEDVAEIIVRTLLLETAKTHRCGTLLFGHNMSRLAEEVLALTITGRGSQIHSSVADHNDDTTGSTIAVKFPLRDILGAEISAYAKLAGIDKLVLTLALTAPTINKHKTVRDLTAQYFRQLDSTGYSSTASTVVRTADKLTAPKVGTYTGCCRVCGTEIRQEPRQWLSRITVADRETTGDAEGDAEGSSQRVEKHPQLCYGCTVTVGDSQAFCWPMSDREIIDEYSL